MPEQKVYYLDEARDKYAEIKRSFVDGKDVDLIYNMINCLIKGGMPRDTIMGYLQNMAILCDPLTMEQEVFDKINRSIEICSKNKREISLAQEIRDFLEMRHGCDINTTEVDKELGITTKCDKRNRSKIMERLVKDGIIEKHKRKSSRWRVIDRTLEIIDRKKDTGKEVNLVLPMHLNELTKVYPKNIIVIAGMSNAGKTAFLLNLVGLNIDKYNNNMIYFSSEMGACELKDRLNKFGLPDEIWDGCVFAERSSSFQDVINPNGINIIDYFEICDNFSMIADHFKAIADKLKEGVAIIALQKTGEKKYGRGGDFSIEKPRLYLTLDDLGDYIEMTIVKAKNWKNKYNPNGLVKHFKIEDGYQLIELGNWHRMGKNGS